MLWHRRGVRSTLTAWQARCACQASTLDAAGRREAHEVLDEAIQGNVFDTHAAVEAFSLIYLNPPYDFEIGEGKNHRMERLFLEHVARMAEARRGACFHSPLRPCLRLPRNSHDPIP
jgi:16S rRNA G966 N2-methylase RsmD